MTTIQTQNNISNQSTNILRTAVAITAGLGTGYFLQQTFYPISKYIKNNYMLKEYKNVDPKAMNDLIQYAITLSGMKEKNLKVNYWNISRACFNRTSNKIFVNLKQSSYSIFHEIGHAINFHNSPFWKSVQKIKKPCFKLIPLPFIISLLTSKKTENDEHSTLLDKGTRFIKNNVGKLTFAISIPIIAEEISATLRGNYLAKKFADPQLYKKVSKINALGTSTYIAYGLVSGIAAYTGSKIRDFISESKSLHPKQ